MKTIKSVNTLVITGDDMADLNQVLQTGEYVSVKRPDLSKYPNVKKVIIVPHSKNQKLWGEHACAVIADLDRQNTTDFKPELSKWKQAQWDRKWNKIIKVKKARAINLRELSYMSTFYEVNCRVAGGIGYCNSYFKL
jgi:uncharacterized protein YvpB